MAFPRDPPALWARLDSVPTRFYGGGMLRPRPPKASELERRIREALNKPGRTEGVRKIAERFGVNPGTVQRISRPFEDASAARPTKEEERNHRCFKSTELDFVISTAGVLIEDVLNMH